MSIEFNCTQCQTLLRVPDTAAGQPVRCPKCSAVGQAPQVGSAAAADFMLPSEPAASAGSAAAGGEVNPYAAPLHSPVSTPAIPDVTGGPLDVGYVLSRTWEIFKIHWGLCLVAALIPTGVQQMVSMVFQLFMGVAMQIDPVLGFASVALAVLVMLPLMVWLNIGQILFFLRVAQGEQPEIPNIFRGGPWILRMIGLWLLLYIVINLAFWACVGVPVGVGLGLGAALGVAEAGAIIGLVVGGVVGLVVLIYLALAYSQAMYLMVDRNTGVIDALRGSWQLTRGNKPAIFLIYLLMGLINIAGLLVCCAGMIATLPYTFLALAVMYTVMAKGSQPGEALG